MSPNAIFVADNSCTFSIDGLLAFYLAISSLRNVAKFQTLITYTAVRCGKQEAKVLEDKICCRSPVIHLDLQMLFNQLLAP